MNYRKWADRYSTDCSIKYNSKSTRDNYISCVKSFLIRFDKYNEPKEVPTYEIKEYLLEFKTINTRKHNLCAIKSFYKLTVGMSSKIDRIPYPRSERKLPLVLSQDEIQRMFDVCENQKHKVILLLLYAAGLRANELINLKWSHIDRSRMIINVVNGKGGKDRQIMLDEKLIPVLESYWKEYKTKTYILSGQFSDKYSKTSVLQVVKQLAEKAEIKKKVWTHLIRHCFGTHLVEAGVDIELIRDLMGHSSTKTTNIYLHISDSLISRIKSPASAIRV